MYPKEFEEIKELFNKLPGVGLRSAERYAFKLIDNKKDIDSICEILKKTKSIKKCETCGFITVESKCLYCNDLSRDKSRLMIVSTCQDAEAVEKTLKYDGMYHILGGLISSSNGIFPNDLNIDTLLKRINPNIKEIIIATPPTTDGEMTAAYIIKLLKDKEVYISRIAKGIPIGSGLEYADEQTLTEALLNRKEVNK